MAQLQDASGVEQMIPQVSHSDHWQEVMAVVMPPAASPRAWSLRRRRVSRLRASFPPPGRWEGDGQGEVLYCGPASI